MTTNLSCFETKERQIKADLELSEEEIEISQADLENVVMESELEINDD